MEHADIIKNHDYEEVSILQNKKAKLFAINVIHDTTRGPAVGGTRFMKYKSEDEAIYDALNLARSMTYKTAAAGLSCGGGRTVIMDMEGEVNCDVFSPCAVGGVMNSGTIPRLRCKMVAGSANNVLGNEQDGNSLYERGIVYAPDYIANAGAVIQWWFRQTAYPVKDNRDGREVIANIYRVMKEILRTCKEKQLTPARVADQYAISKLNPEKTYQDMNWGVI